MVPYERIVLPWFSGTGNAFTVARWIAAGAEASGVHVELLSMERGERPSKAKGEGRTLFCFCYPTHGFAAPWLVLRYLWRFPRLPRADAFFVNTRGGVRLPFLFTPGVSGVALWVPVLLFALRGFRVAGSLPVDMPHNWTSFFPPNPRRGVEKLVARSRRIVATTTTRLLRRTAGHRWSVWLTLPLDLALLPVAILYLAAGRFGLARTLFASIDCNDCGLCIESCPVGAIAKVDGRPYWKLTCESCLRCMNACPRRAIQSWVTRMALFLWPLLLLGSRLWPIGFGPWLVILTPVVLLAYRVLHRAWGIRVVNAAFTFTSLTRAWKRYFAPGVRARDLGGLGARAGEGEPGRS